MAAVTLIPRGMCPLNRMPRACASAAYRALVSARSTGACIAPRSFESSARACGDSCSVGPGEHCVARSPGYQAKRFSYDELKAHSSRGRARIEVKLTTAP